MDVHQTAYFSINIQISKEKKEILILKLNVLHLFPNILNVKFATAPYLIWITVGKLLKMCLEVSM